MKTIVKEFPEKQATAKVSTIREIDIEACDDKELMGFMDALYDVKGGDDDPTEPPAHCRAGNDDDRLGQ